LTRMEISEMSWGRLDGLAGHMVPKGKPGMRLGDRALAADRGRAIFPRCLAINW
jgi:hypothetical protein